MFRRRVLLSCAMCATAIVSAGLIVRTATRPYSRMAPQFKQVQAGMSFDEVVRLVGPPGDYRVATNGLVALSAKYYKSGSMQLGSDVVNWTDFAARWEADDAELCVLVRKDGCVLCVQVFYPDDRWRTDDFWDRVTSCLGF